MWENILKDLNIKPVFITTYNTLAGKTQTKLNHPYLTKNNKEYKVTKTWKKYNGVFIVCDESQAIKNKTSARHWAVTELINNNKNGKLLHLTASPIDKNDNWACLYRNLGIVSDKLMVCKQQLMGLGQIYNIIKKHDEKLYKKALQFDTKSKHIPDILSYLWHEFFIHKYTIKVIDPIYKDISGKDYEKKLCNYFATLDNEGMCILNNAVGELSEQKIVINGVVNVKNVQRNIGQIQLFLVQLCIAKVNTLVRLTINKLNDTHKKVIICCPYINAQELLYTKLKDYNPLILNGKTKNRPEVIDLFNEPNDNHRCLIMTSEVGGEGISLQDIDGNYPRVMYIVPTHHFLKMYQSSGRIYRRGMKSDTEVYMVYSNDGAIESIIVNTLAKTEIASSILLPGSGRLFPGNFPYEIEDDCEKYNDLKLALNDQIK